ncbi:hypothetical protein F4803DRAFT_548213 [Xylaria telfairii]|nr:hypothetical protein F4803DRAFT_548213 [Xylaria telfairii]
MKLSLGLALMLFSVASMGWQAAVLDWKEKIGDFLSNPSKQSRVPQFILDARHPWILENQSKLERLPDAGSYLCSQSQASTTDITENGLNVPHDLFEYLEINNNRAGINRPGWPNALLRLQEIHSCPAALSQVKTFYTDIYVYRSRYDDLDKRVLESHQPPKEVLDLFVDVLGNMTNLETLKWKIPASDASYLEEHFAERGLVLPSVRRLEPGSMTPFIVRTCPNITTLEVFSTKQPEALLQAAMFAPNLTRFAMGVDDGWTPSLIQDLVSIYLPGIESLGLWGGVSTRYQYDFDRGSKDSALKESLQLLQSLKNLTYLDLPSASSLDVGWDGGPWCGNAFMGPGGRENERRVLRDQAKAVNTAAALVVEFLPHLTGFNIGESTANLTRYENGTLRASFPWTGRINEWVMEVLPLGPDVSPEWADME